MLGSGVKSAQPEVELSGCGDEGADEPRGAGRKAADGRGMLPKRAKAPGGGGSGVAKASAAELKVFKSGSVDGRVPGGPPASNLRKQKSLTNLSFLTDSEKKLQLYEPEWSDDMAKAPKGLGKAGSKGREGPLMSKTLSKSEHSLFQAKGSPAGGAKTPLAPLAPSLGKPSRIPRGPYAEVKPLSKAPEAAVSDDGKSDDELLSSKARAQKGCAPAPPAKGQEERAFLKVDPELVVTVLGDLEQLLFSQMLGESRHRPPPFSFLLSPSQLHGGVGEAPLPAPRRALRPSGRCERALRPDVQGWPAARRRGKRAPSDRCHQQGALPRPAWGRRDNAVQGRRFSEMEPLSFFLESESPAAERGRSGAVAPPR